MTRSTTSRVTQRRRLSQFTSRATIPRIVDLVREVICAHDRLTKPARRSSYRRHDTTKKRRLTPMARYQKTTFPTAHRAAAQPIDADLIQRERRYMRAIEGWLVSAMRAEAHQRQQRRPEGGPAPC
jgi:hypothetical protein